MIFRLGGLGLLCIFGLFLLRDASPIYLLAVVIGYVVIATTLLVRKRANVVSDDEARYPGDHFPDFPLNRFTYLCKIIMWVALISFALAMVFRAKPFAVVGWIVCLICFGVLGFVSVALFVQFGYVPSRIVKGGYAKGISRESDPLQFWLTVGLTSVVGGGFMFLGLSGFASLFTQ